MDYREYTPAGQPLTNYGFKDYNGNVWPNAWIDTYNNHTRDVNRYAGRVIHTDSLTHKARENALNLRHKFYGQCVEIALTRHR